MIEHEYKTAQIRDFITCAFLNCRRAIVARSGFLFACTRAFSLAGSRGQLVAALPLCADVSATAPPYPAVQMIGGGVLAVAGFVWRLSV